jgi:hypothetical protein
VLQKNPLAIVTCDDGTVKGIKDKDRDEVAGDVLKRGSCTCADDVLTC